MNPGGGSGWDEPPLDIQIPDDARELDRDVLAYHRELRAKRRRDWLRRLAGPLAGRGPSCRCWPASWPCAWWQARCCRWPRSARRRCPPSRRPGRRRRPRRPSRAAAVKRRGQVVGGQPRRDRRVRGRGQRVRGQRVRGQRVRHQRVRHQRVRDQPRSDQPVRDQRGRDQQGEPLGEPASLLDPAEPGRPLGWLGLTWSPASTRRGMTATIFFRPTGVDSRRPLR